MKRSASFDEFSQRLNVCKDELFHQWQLGSGLLRASFRQQTATRQALVSTLLRPFAYILAIIMHVELVLAIVPHTNLQLSVILAAVFAALISLLISSNRSLSLLGTSIITNKFDSIRLQPVELFFYKYLRQWQFTSICLIIYSIVAFLWLSLSAHIAFWAISQVGLFILIASFVRINMLAMATAVVFISSRQNLAYRFYNIINPQPAPYQTANQIISALMHLFIVYTLPFTIICKICLNLLYHRETIWVWPVMIIAGILSWYGNTIAWKKGLSHI